MLCSSIPGLNVARKKVERKDERYTNWSARADRGWPRARRDIKNCTITTLDFYFATDLTRTLIPGPGAISDCQTRNELTAMAFGQNTYTRANKISLVPRLTRTPCTDNFIISYFRISFPSSQSLVPRPFKSLGTSLTQSTWLDDLRARGTYESAVVSPSLFTIGRQQLL